MNQNLMCSALARTARGVIPTPAGSASFSTTSPRSVLKNIPSRQGRLAAAASELSSLNDSSESRFSKNTSENDSTNNSSSLREPVSSTGSNPRFSRAPPSRDADTGTQPRSKIINLRSLPRSGLSGSSNSRFPGPSGVSTPVPRFSRSGNPNPAFKTSLSPQNGGGDRGGGGRFAGRSLGPRGSAGAGGMRRSPRRMRKNDDKKNVKNNAQQADEYAYPTEDMRKYMESLNVGQAVLYEPALTLEGLMGYGPAVASAQGSSSRGPVSSVLRSMRVMSDGYAFAGAQEEGASVTSTLHNPQLLIERLHDGKTVFFDTADERAMVDKALHSNKVLAHLKKRKLPEDTTLIAPLPDAAKEAIVDAAVRGVYETNRTTAAPSGSLLATYHRYQSLSYTYTEQQAASFDKKILELLPQAAAETNSAKGDKARAKV
ncbi:MAG: hypothetical protein SEPTF4163_006477 [Sporothrix epigloea]